jgi:hypothetical protein
VHAKQHVKELLDKPEHKKPKGSPEDEATRDNDLEDPAHQSKGDQ